jgi:hypothetical protein
MGPDDPASDVIKLQEKIVTNAIGSGSTITTNEAGSKALAAYLNAAYNGGAGSGSWVFLRLSMDGTPGGVNRYAINTADEINEARLRPRGSSEILPAHDHCCNRARHRP